MAGKRREMNYQERVTETRRILEKYLDETGISEEIQREQLLRASTYQDASELMYNPYESELYRRILENGVENDVFFRVNIVGNFKQGKTSLARRLVGQNICDVKSTNGIDVDRYRCEKTGSGKFSWFRCKELDDSDVVKRLAYATLKGNKKIRRTGKREEYSKHSSAATEEASDIDNAEVVSLKVQTPAHNEKADPFVATPINQCLPQKGLKNLITMLNQEQKKEENLVTLYIYDFAGQHIFYATHTLFHSRKAVYLLVFDLTLKLKDKVEDFEDESRLATGNRTVEDCLRFWVNSIHSFVGDEEGLQPQIILVGTHKDKVKGDTSDIDRYFRDIRNLFEGTEMVNHFVTEEFAVNNFDHSDDSFSQLREKIIEIGDCSTKFARVPAKWIQLEKSLIEIRHKMSKNIVSLDTVLEIDAHNEVPIADIEQIKLFLKYHHEKGTLFYFDEEPISNCVVLDPQYLIDAFKCIITSERFSNRQFRKYWQVLMKEAKLDEKLIVMLWGSDKTNNFMEFKTELLAFLNKHHILSEAMIFDEPTQSSRGLGWYVVPSLLRNHSSSSEIEEFMQGKKRTILRFVMQFEYSSIVPTIYHCLISAALGRWPVANFRDKYLIYQNLSVLRIDKQHCGILEMSNCLIEIHVVSLCPSVDVNEEMVDTFRRFSESVVLFEFRKHRCIEDRNGLKKPYTSMYKCNHESHGGHASIKCEEISELHKAEFTYLPCPDNESHDICVKKAKMQWFLGSKIPSCNTKILLNEKLLGKLACTIGDNWQLLGLELGLSQITVQHIQEDYPRTALKIFQMLRAWCSDLKDEATMNTLVHILQRRRDVSVDWDGIRNIIEEETDKHNEK